MGNDLDMGLDGHTPGLIERIEAAGPEMQAALLDEAWEVCAAHSAAFRHFARSHCSGFGTNAGRFGAAMDARAYETAAMMLVPNGRGWNMQGNTDTFYAVIAGHGSKVCTTPALAIASAALRLSGITHMRGSEHDVYD